MSEEISNFQDHINQLFLTDSKVFYLLVDKELRVQLWHGESDHYGFTNLQQGQERSDDLSFINGLESAAPFTRLDFLATPSGKHAHILVSRSAEGWGLAFLDVSREADELRSHQQKANNLRLEMEQKEKQLSEMKSNLEQLQKQIK